jgi:hypothetical protein
MADDGETVAASASLTLALRAFPVTEAVVFADRAEVRRTVTLPPVPAGTSEVLLQGLSPAVDTDSIRYVVHVCAHVA